MDRSISIHSKISAGSSHAETCCPPSSDVSVRMTDPKPLGVVRIPVIEVNVKLPILALVVAHAEHRVTARAWNLGPQSQSAERAAKDCKAERLSIGIEAFAKRYGTNHNLRNAFGKCVSPKAIAKARRPSSSNGLIGGS